MATQAGHNQDPQFLPSSDGVERSVIFLLVGISVLVVFILVIAGMGTVQDTTIRELSEPDRQSAEDEEERNRAEIEIVPSDGSQQDAP